MKAFSFKSIGYRKMSGGNIELLTVVFDQDRAIFLHLKRSALSYDDMSLRCVDRREGEEEVQPMNILPSPRSSWASSGLFQVGPGMLAKIKGKRGVGDGMVFLCML